MTEQRYSLSEPFEIRLAEGNGAPKEIQVLRTGKFKHPVYGRFEITSNTLQEFVANFKNKVRKIDLAVDYKHESEDIAAGWMRDLTLKDDGRQLWAEIDWTKKGKTVVEDKEFRYVSADFQFSYEDPETEKKFGPTLLGAGLTNRPFVKGMSPAVGLTENHEGDAMNIEQLQKENTDLKAKLAELEGSVKKLSESQDIEKRDAEIADLRKQLQTMTDEKAATEKKAADDKKLADTTAKFEVLLSEGKACEAQRDAFLKGNMEEFVKLAEPTNMNPKGSGATRKEESKGSSAQDQIIALAEKAMKEDGIKDIGVAQSKVIADPKNAELVKKYHAETSA